MVRTPWDELVSLYRWHEDPPAIKTNKGKISFKEWVKQGCKTDWKSERWKNYSWGENWFGKNGFPSDPLKQLDYLTDPNGKMLVDFIGRFETLQKDFNKACDKIGIPGRKLPRTNITDHKHYSKYYGELELDSSISDFGLNISFLSFSNPQSAIGYSYQFSSVGE